MTMSQLSPNDVMPALQLLHHNQRSPVCLQLCEELCVHVVFACQHLHKLSQTGWMTRQQESVRDVAIPNAITCMPAIKHFDDVASYSDHSGTDFWSRVHLCLQ